MTKFFFFRSVRERNAQGQMRIVLYPLEGQTTYRHWNDLNHPVNTGYKVQVTLEQNHKVVSLPVGMIFGVKYTSTRSRDLALKIYSRNGVNFYRTENELFLVTGSRSNICASADSEMMEAYGALVGNASGTAAPDPAPAPQQSAPAPSAAPAAATGLNLVPVPSNEMDMIENHLRGNMGMTESDALARLVRISKIKDRMKNGVACFTFIKQNGDVRRAFGTRCAEIIAQLGGGTRRDEGSTGNDGAHFCYFDVQKADWRCFCVEDLRTADLDYYVTDMVAVQAIRNEFLAS